MGLEQNSKDIGGFGLREKGMRSLWKQVIFIKPFFHGFTLL